MKDKLLNKAIIMAVEAHAGQTDKGGAPYIFHPMRLMLATSDPDEQVVAILHDVMEDSDTSVEDLLAIGVTDYQMQALVLMCKDYALTYQQYVEKIGEHPLARKVKLLDLADNMDLTRLQNVTQKDYDRTSKYAKTVEYLRSLS